MPSISFKTNLLFYLRPNSKLAIHSVFKEFKNYLKQNTKQNIKTPILF